MSSNPFFVDVSGGGGSSLAATTPEQKFAQAGSGSALSGLGQVVAGVRQQRQLSADKTKKEQRLAEFQARFKAVRSPEELIQLQIDFPELSKAQSNVMTAREKMLGEDRKEIFANVWGWRDSKNPVQSITQSINRNPRYAEDDFVIEALGRAREAEESGDFTEFQRWIDMTQATFNPKGYEARAEMQKAERESLRNEYTNVTTGTDGKQYGLNKKTGEYEQIPTPAGVTFPTKTGQTINIDKGESEEQKGVGGFEAETFNAIQQAGINANKQIATLNRLEKLSEDAFSGTLSGVKKAFAGVFSEMGIDSEGLDATQTFEALSNSLVLDKAQSMSGALSDRDVSFLESTAPSLKQTASGRKKLIQIMREMAQVEKQYARDAAQFRKERGRFNQIEFEDWVREKRGDEDKLAKYFAGTEFEQSEQSAPQKPQVRSLIKEDDEAREWLRKNPNHPDAPAVRASLGEG